MPFGARASGFYVAPIREGDFGSGDVPLFYDRATNEIVYSTRASNLATSKVPTSYLATSIVSANSTLNTDNQVVATSGTITITLPVNPIDGQNILIYADGDDTSVNPNGKTIRIAGVNYTSAIQISQSIRLIYVVNKWFSL
ncbi:hypothetical protein P700755_003988 [Psychroflexus torquis ATCC 700755]|uniref:Uncharacterized protein n=2 Tax=Psychroflexus TaxID=83612 RepID=K4INF6_PSYTT|nr:hypothetical protein P700755_003988 [Psychroflexus torquis ATCC 700755]